MQTYKLFIVLLYTIVYSLDFQSVFFWSYQWSAPTWRQHFELSQFQESETYAFLKPSPT